MVPETSTTPAAAIRHPPELVDADRHYLVPWGRREIRRVLGAAAAGGLGVLALAVYSSPFWALALLPVVLPAALLVLFFRNPSRSVPASPGVLLSPADGVVRDITIVEENEFVGAPCVRIGIFLSIFDVHLNRAPSSGWIEWVRHEDGAHHDARSDAAVGQNESNSLGIVRDDAGGPSNVRLLVKQISGAIARRIICPIAPRTAVVRGGLLGMIKYGSRTELYVPQTSGAEIRVRIGSKVRAGSTVLAAWPAANLDSE